MIYFSLLFYSRTAVDSMLLSWRRLSPEKAAKHERCRRLTETFLWFGLALLLAAVVPNIGVAIALIGGLAALFIFVFTGKLEVYALRETWVSEVRSLGIGRVRARNTNLAHNSRVIVIIDSGQKDVEVLCVALVSYESTII